MNKTFKNNVVKLLSGSIIVQIINLGTQPIITRLYSPTDYGVLSLITSIVGVAGIIGFLSYERAIPIVKNDKDALSFAKSLLSFICVLVLFLVVGLLVIHVFIKFKYSLIILLLGIFLFGISLSDSVLTNINYKNGDYSSVAKRKVIVAIFSSIIQVLLGWYAFGAEGLLISLCVCTTVGVFLIGKKYLPMIWQSNFASKQMFWDYRRLAMIETPQNLINAFSIQFPVYFISSSYGVAITGQYSLAMRLIAVPAAIITSSFSDVFTQNFAKLYHEKGDFRGFTLQIWRKLILLGMIPTVIILIAGPQIFAFIFGAKWLMAGQIARIMCISTWIAILSGTTLFAFMIMNRGKIMFLYSTLLFLSRAIGMYILIHNLWYGLIFYVASEAIIRLMWLHLLNITMLKEFNNLNLQEDI